MSDSIYTDIIFELENDQNIDTYEKSEILSLVTGSWSDEELISKLDNLGQSFFGQGQSTPLWAQVSTSDNRSNIYEAFKKEFLDFLCTDSPKYKKDRAVFTWNAKGLVGIAMTIGLSSFDGGLTVLSGMAYCLVFTSIKMGKNSFCSLHVAS